MMSCRSSAFGKFFFFFQAEDGIRDVAVTGVQTCALPICHRRPSARARFWLALDGSSGGYRSEERRVGKECRSRGSPYQLKKKKNMDRWRISVVYILFVSILNI